MTAEPVLITGLDQKIPVSSPRARAMIVTILALLAQIDNNPKGRLIFSWGDAPGVKWEIAGIGRTPEVGST